MARPTKRSPERDQAIFNALRVGNTRTDSVLAAGVSLDSLARWIAADAEFRGGIEKAEAEARMRFVGQIAKAAARTWQAAAWVLERRDPEHWGRKERLDVTMDVRREVERLTSDPQEQRAAIEEAERILSKARS